MREKEQEKEQGFRPQRSAVAPAAAPATALAASTRPVALSIHVGVGLIGRDGCGLRLIR